VTGPRRREEVVFRPLSDEWVLYDPATRRLHVLNLTAALVWSYCDGTRDVMDLVRSVRAAFREAPDEARVGEDVREALEAFAREGLVR
jgi:hypothetical protein